jgi:hypothetical protein
LAGGTLSALERFRDGCRGSLFLGHGFERANLLSAPRDAPSFLGHVISSSENESAYTVNAAKRKYQVIKSGFKRHSLQGR